MEILLEKLSLIHILLSWGLLRRARIIRVFDPYDIQRAKKGTLQKRLSFWLLKKINRRAVTEIDRQTRNWLGYLNRHASDIHIESVMKRVRAMPSYGIMRGLIAHKEIDRIYCRFLLDKISRESQFYQTAEFFLNTHGEIVLIPHNDDYWNLGSHFQLAGAATPSRIVILNKIWGCVRRRLGSFFLNGLIWPTVIILHIAKYFRKRPSVPVFRANIIIPIFWGFAGEDGLLDNSEGARKIQWDDASLIDGPLNCNNVTFYYDSFEKFNAATRLKNELWMSKRGIKWFDAAGFSADSVHKKEVKTIAARLLRSFILEPEILTEPHEICRISGYILYYFLRELLFNRSVHYQVRVEWCDYTPITVMRTIVANRFGRASVGVHHSANGLTYGFPEIRYSFINRLCVWNKKFMDAYAHHWNAFECVPIGNHRLDYIIKSQEPARLQELRSRVRKFWNISGYIALITLPTYPKRVNYQDPGRFPEFYRGLLRCLEEIPELWMVLRARGPESFTDYLVEPLVRELSAHPRLISDYEKLSTFEWMAVADAVVGTSCSTTVIEAATAGIKSFSFDVRGIAGLIFSGYGSDFVLNNSGELVRALKGALFGLPQLDCNWEKFRREMTYFRDGRNIERFREAIYDLAVKVENKQYF